MENLADYSNYVLASYIISDLVLIAFAAFTLRKYFRLKKSLNEKSA